MAEVYYVMSGDGTATIDGETVQIHPGDAVPAALGESRAFAATGNAPLELMVIGIAKDLESKKAYMLTGRKSRPHRAALGEEPCSFCMSPSR